MSSEPFLFIECQYDSLMYAPYHLRKDVMNLIVAAGQPIVRESMQQLWTTFNHFPSPHNCHERLSLAEHMYNEMISVFDPIYQTLPQSVFGFLFHSDIEKLVAEIQSRLIDQIQTAYLKDKRKEWNIKFDDMVELFDQEKQTITKATN